MKEEEFFVNTLLEFAEENLRSYPWRATDDPYRVLMAEIMLRRTRADQVEGVYNEFIKRYPTMEDLSRANEDDLREILETLGLVNRRLKMMHETVEEVGEKYGGNTPTNPEELKGIDELGDYIANATACFAANRRFPILDTNVRRLISRYFGISDQKKIAKKAQKLLPNSDYRTYNLALLDFPAVYCRPNPDCNNCTLNKACIYAN
ncbi:MAG: G/T mismatches repair enzyme [Methanonatronarchaeales archaeon]|nr:G/T mismatches repair enzyme [Methanonatronarchaeales archaeon]